MILINALWTISLAALFAGSLSASYAQEMLMVKRELSGVSAYYDMYSAVNQAKQTILLDPTLHEDSALEDWYGKIEMTKPWAERVLLSVGDENAKLNLNYVSQNLLETVLKKYEEEEGRAGMEAKKFAEAVMEKRMEGRFASMDELRLIEGISGADLERVCRFFTVYTETPFVNINTVPPLVLQCLIKSLGGGEFSKHQLYESIIAFKENNEGIRERRAFTAADLDPERFKTAVKAKPGNGISALVLQLVPLLTVDSETFTLDIRVSGGYRLQAVIAQRGEWDNFDILSWEED